MIRQTAQEPFIVVFLLLVAIASTIDLVADLQEGVNTSHVLQEATILVIALASLGWIGFSLRSNNRELRKLQIELKELKNQPQTQPKEVVEIKRRLATVITDQFESWLLTKSEREIGLLLLKGFSLREIAALRGTSEKTIRQQASSIYKKAGLSGRYAFSAWFIEDIL
ncbi:MAG: hypothetical protein R3E54_08285 [Halioglobus sp.]